MYRVVWVQILSNNRCLLIHDRHGVSAMSYVGMNQTHSNHVALISNANGDDYCAQQLLFDNESMVGVAPLTCDEFDVSKPITNHVHPIMGQCGRHYLVDCDALICNDSRVLLGVKTADCLPIFIVGDGLLFSCSCRSGWNVGFDFI